MPKKRTLIQTLTVVTLIPLSGAFAQQDSVVSSQNTDSNWIGVVITENTPIKCGANDSYYTVAMAKKGDLVRVHGKQRGWFKIDASGSVFNESVGYLKYPTEDPSVFEIDGNIGVVRGDLEVLANNIESDDLYRSWRPVLRLTDGDSVQVLQTITTEPGTLHRNAYVVHTVKMPETATCWISASNITISSDNQVSATKNETGAESSESGDVSISVEKTEPETNNQLTLAELEGIWEKMTSEPVMGAEVLPLRDMYDEMLSTSSGDIVVEQVACGRIKQLDVWAGLQDQRMRINVLRLKLAKRSEDFVDLHTSISNDAYALSGRLGLSNTFDGNLRPFMYRIQDERSGRTLGYLPKNDAFELTDLVGHTVGIIGTRKWNPTWRINTVDIKRVDLLSPTTAIAAPDIQ